jgi:hypothetical protein
MNIITVMVMVMVVVTVMGMVMSIMPDAAMGGTGVTGVLMFT